MEIDGNGGSVDPYCEQPPSDPPPSDPPPEPNYYPPPQDTVETSSSTPPTRDESAEAWAESTIAAAEQYAIDNPGPNEFGWKPAEERAQDAFWENDPNRPTSTPEASSQPAQPQPEGDDRDPKNPVNKPQEPPSDPNAPGPDLSGGRGPVPAKLLPKPEPLPPQKNPAFDFRPLPPEPAPTPNGIRDFITDFPVVPTHDTTHGPNGEPTDLWGIRTRPRDPQPEPPPQPPPVGTRPADTDP